MSPRAVPLSAVKIGFVTILAKDLTTDFVKTLIINFLGARVSVGLGNNAV
jgi:hypothetical protein